MLETARSGNESHSHHNVSLSRVVRTHALQNLELVTGSPTTGTGFALAEGSPTNRFSLEVWQEVAGAGACDESGAQRYVYHAWPNVGGVQKQEYTIELGRSA